MSSNTLKKHFNFFIVKKYYFFINIFWLFLCKLLEKSKEKSIYYLFKGKHYINTLSIKLSNIY